MTLRELQASVLRRDGATIIDLAGEIDAGAEAALAVAAEEAFAHGEPVVLDFSRTAYINSTGIALIVGLLAQARARALPVSAAGLSAHYREIFEITRLADFMTIIDEGGSRA